MFDLLSALIFFGFGILAFFGGVWVPTRWVLGKIDWLWWVGWVGLGFWEFGICIQPASERAGFWFWFWFRFPCQRGKGSGIERRWNVSLSLRSMMVMLEWDMLMARGHAGIGTH